MTSTYLQDIEESRAKERELCRIFRKKGFDAHNTQDLEEFPDYDILLTDCEGKTKTIELKLDRMAQSTSRVAVELYKFSPHTKEKTNSGLSATSATNYCYCFTDDPNYYIISTKKLKKLVANKEQDRTVQGGDQKLYTLALFDSASFKAYCTTINPKSYDDPR